MYPAQQPAYGGAPPQGQVPHVQQGQYAQHGQYPQQGQPYAQQAPYAQQQPYAQHGQQPYPQQGASAPHGAHAQPSAPSGRKSSKALLLAIAGVAVAAGIVVAIVVAKRGGGGMGSQDELAKATVAALAKGDADALTKLGDPGALAALMECKKDDGDDDTERKRKELREQNDELVAKTKGHEIELVAITQRPPRLDANGKNKGAFEKGQKLSSRCTAKVAIVAHKVDVKLEVGGGEATMTIEMVEAEGRWYLVDDIDLEMSSSVGGGAAGAGGAAAGTGELLATATSFRDRMCACKDKACADGVQQDMTRWSMEQAKAAASVTIDQATVTQMTTVMEAYSKCMTGALGTSVGASAGSGAGSGSAAAAPLVVGDRVMARWTDGHWYPGKITRIRDDGTFDVAYDDGDSSKALPASKVRKRTASSSSGSRKSSADNDAPCPGPGITRRCNGVCVNIQENSNHCGACNYVCPSGKTCQGLFCRDADGNL